MGNHLKTKKYHNSTQNCPFSMIFRPKWPKFHGDSFPDVKRSKFLYIWRVLTICLIFWYKNMFFFKGQKSEKVLASQQRLAPPLGGDHMVPYGTLWFSICSMFLYVVLHFSIYQFSIVHFPDVFNLFQLFPKFHFFNFPFCYVFL